MRKKLQALVDALKGEPKHGTLEFAYRDASEWLANNPESEATIQDPLDGHNAGGEAGSCTRCAAVHPELQEGKI
jgi:hypothetical protein